MIGEKVVKNKEVILNHLKLNTDASILNIEFFKDTSQVNVVLQTRGLEHEQKLKKMAVVLPAESVKELKDSFLSLIYPHFEAKQVELSRENEFSDIMETKKEEAEEKIKGFKESLDGFILEIKAESLEAVEKIKENNQPITADNRLAVMKEIEAQEKKESEMIENAQEDFTKHCESLKEEKQKEGVAIIESEKAKIRSDYGI